MKLLIICAVTLLSLAACWAATNDGLTSEVRNRIIREKFGNNPLTYLNLVREGNVRNCGNYIYVNYHAEVDGPLYYFNKDGSLAFACGGACFHPQSPEQDEVCRTKCAPDYVKCE